jgi:ribA/ribD-fused uncharacterized protein
MFNVNRTNVNRNNKNIVSEATTGLRISMEDGYSNTKFRVNNDIECALSVVVDGHGGKTCANAVLNALPGIILSNITKDLHITNENVINILNGSFAKMASMMLSAEYSKCGACVCVTLILGSEIWTANLGDTESIMLSDNTVKVLTYAHKATDELEISRITEAGGKILYDRLNGNLAVTRAFGDTAYSPYILSMPHISYVTVENPSKLIIATDGLWDVYKSEDIIKTDNTAYELLKYAIQHGTDDNITITVIDVQSYKRIGNITACSFFDHEVVTPSSFQEKYSSIFDYSCVDSNFSQLYLLDTAYNKEFMEKIHKYDPLYKRRGAKLPHCVTVHDVLGATNSQFQIYDIDSGFPYKFGWCNAFTNLHTDHPFDEPSIIVDGKPFKCTEAYYQWMKTIGTGQEDIAYNLLKDTDPSGAYLCGRRVALRSDWDSVRFDAMVKALYCKFSQHEELKKLLLSTGLTLLVRPSVDKVWGTGSDGTGLNLQGKAIMKVRDMLRQV